MQEDGNKQPDYYIGSQFDRATLPMRLPCSPLESKEQGRMWLDGAHLCRSLLTKPTASAARYNSPHLASKAISPESDFAQLSSRDRETYGAAINNKGGPTDEMIALWADDAQHGGGVVEGTIYQWNSIRRRLPLFPPNAIEQGSRCIAVSPSQEKS